MLIFKRIAAISVLSLATICASAQFYQNGDDPASVRWSHLKTPDFHIIYAKGQDSVALSYASALEQWRIPVSGSIGYTPNGCYRSQMPVVLHPLNALANGSVTWAPRRMDLYTLPDPYNPEPLPWVKTLAIHESRHVAQLQFTKSGRFVESAFLFGEMWGGALAAIYGGPAFFEGDAVTAETALTRTGRGRKADFLEYPMVALDNGDWRDWFGWRYSSIKRYTPDHYRVGYMSVAGMRTVYDEPLFAEKYYSNIQRKSRIFPKKYPIFPPVNVMRKTTKQISGKKPKESFREIEEAFLDDWRKGFEERGPFMPMDTVTATPRRYSELTGITMAGNHMYAIHKGLEQAATIARIDADGEVRDLRPFASVTSAPQWSSALGKLFWSENISDKRWSMASNSIIRYMDPEDGKIRNLTREGRLFHPAPQPDGEKIAVTEYTLDTRSVLLVLDGRSGDILEQFAAPDSLQIVESAWSGDDIYVTAISECGEGIYKAGAIFTQVLSPLPVTIKQPRSSSDGRIMFVSDRSGVNEIYALDVRNGAVEQLSCTRYGVADFAFSEGDKELYYSALAPEARYICRTPASELPRRSVAFGDIHHYAIADELSEQEKALPQRGPASIDSLCMEPKPWHKAAHLIHIHSWVLPFYVDYDSVKDFSYEEIESTIALGATAFFQNAMGTSYGSLGYTMNWTQETGFRHGAHLKFNYSGLYPVIETSLNINDSFAGQYQLYRVKAADGSVSYARGYKASDTPSVNGSIRMYVPLNFSSGGWVRGVVPQLRYNVTNSRFSTSERGVISVPGLYGENISIFGGYTPGENVLLHRVSASVRGYCMRPTAEAGVFPRLGIGAEAGFTGRIGLMDLFSPAVFGTVYGYLPGLMPQHGLKLNLLTQQQLGSSYHFGENYTSTYPRGLAGIASYISAAYPSQNRMSAEYRMAVAPVDWTWLGTLAYIRNFELSGFCDLGAYAGSKLSYLSDKGTAYSAGGEFCVVLGNMLWIPYDTRIGISFAYNGGSVYDGLCSHGVKLSRTYVGATFSIDM